MYYNNGDCQVGLQRKKKVGVGFRTGEKLKINVNLNSGTVQWTVNNEIRHK